jgi:hypothetical protein
LNKEVKAMRSKIWLSFSLILVLSGIGLSQTAKKTITNLDLEKYKQQREKAEAEYRAKYKDLGMPSPEELERRNAEDQRWREEFSRQRAYENQQNQSYWITQANYLRNQIISVDAQINYLNGLLGSIPAQNQIFMKPEEFSAVSVGSFGVFGGRGGGRRAPITRVNSANNVQTVINAASANPNPFYGTPLQNNGVKVVIGQQGGTRRRGFGGSFFGGGYTLPYAINNNNLRREEVIANLQYLGQVRAGLLAQWNNLVDEAHRAGVKID